MLTQQQPTEVIAVQECSACATGLLKHDKFCRRCGVRQAEGNGASTDPNRFWARETQLLTERTQGLETYSAQLIRIVTQNVSMKVSKEKTSRGFRRLICTLITLPIWMLIVLLSPLDAYTAAKAAAGNMTCV